MILENLNTYHSQSATICSIAPNIGCTPETLRSSTATGKIMPLLENLNDEYGVGPVCQQLGLPLQNTTGISNGKSILNDEVGHRSRKMTDKSNDDRGKEWAIVEVKTG